jgi:hypothetical protein
VTRQLIAAPKIRCPDAALPELLSGLLEYYREAYEAMQAAREGSR